ncbi:secreted protein, partial [marine sediment metagenome]
MRPVLAATLLFALSALTLILLRPLMPVDETRYLAAAWEMHAGGSPWVPHLNRAIYGHKPPLLFWLINLVWASSASMRLRP